MNPADLRASIPALEDCTYLNTGASGPSPRRVVEAAETTLEHQEYTAPTSEGMYTVAFDTYDETRETIAAFLDADPAEIALTQSTTDGINRVACALDWQPGDAIVRTDLEHPAGILPWQRLNRTDDIEVRVVPSEAGRLDMDAYRRAVTDARLVCVSSITWNYGTSLPVETLVDIAHDAGALVLVDAVQSPGQTPVSVTDWGADIVAAASHKWLLGHWGAGYLYVDNDVAETLSPRAIGYRGVVTPTDAEYEYKPGAHRLEIGTTNPAPYAATQAAIETLEAIGLPRIDAHIEDLATRLADGIPDERLLSPATPESGLVTIDVDDPTATVDRLKDDDIVIRELPDPDAVRASVHVFNTAGDIDRLLTALESEW
ncbi:MAG: aminotransferase class V-fold PLP-dependent enzyme [Halobacteriaceae archaeon]